MKKTFPNILILVLSLLLFFCADNVFANITGGETMPVTFEGGQKTQKFFDQAGKGGVKGVDIGFFASAKYQDGTFVAAVAAWNEFGTKHIPERPAIRQSIKANEANLVRIITKNIDTKKMVIDRLLADKIGLSQVGAQQKSMVDLKEPANAPSTLKQKFPKTNPLVNTGTMIRSVTHKVNA